MGAKRLSQVCRSDCSLQRDRVSDRHHSRKFPIDKEVSRTALFAAPDLVF